MHVRSVAFVAVASFAIVGCVKPGQVMSRASDGGAALRWSVQAISGGPSLRAVSAPSAGVVWASGTKGTIVRSVDGCASFAIVPPADAAGLDFRMLVAFDAQRAVVATAGTPARVYRTTDGGRSWLLALEDARQAAFFDVLAFADEQRGYLFGDPIDGAMQCFETEDGGATWRAVPAAFLPRPIEGEVFFAASCSAAIANGESVFAVSGGMASRFLASSSKARGFQVAALPIANGKASSGAFSIAKVGDAGFVIVGGDYLDPSTKQGAACRSEDGGATFQPSVEPPEYCSAVCCLDNKATCVATGPTRSWISRDGGRSFQSLTDEGFHALAACGDMLYAVGSDGRIATMRWRAQPASDASVAPR